MGLLIVGFDRPELLKNRVEDLANTYIPNIYISIDGGESSHTPAMFEALEYAKRNLNYTNLTIKHHQNNQGAVDHIISQISNVLIAHDYIIYLDDDIKLSSNFITNIVKGLEILEKENLNGVVTGHSRVFNKNFPNKWRKVNMAYPQGCAFSALIWKGFQKNISLNKLESELSRSSRWKNLNSIQKNFWVSKFRNVAKYPNHTWDYQFTYHCFINDFTIIAPVFSIVGNEGYGYSTSLHNTGKKPTFIANNRLNSKVISDFSGFNKLHEFFEIDNIYLRCLNRLRKEVNKYFTLQNNR